jgi:hypothetical protein
MAHLERTRSAEVTSGVERSFEVRLGGLGGLEVRPTRIFLWRGPDRDASERVLPLAEQPVGLEYERREGTVRVGELTVRSVGNPLLTLAMTGTIAIRRWLDPERPNPRR